LKDEANWRDWRAMNIKKDLLIVGAGPVGLQRRPQATVTAHAAS
jgi:hypothetical protein